MQIMNRVLVDNPVRIKQIAGWGPFFLFLLHNTEEGLYMTSFAFRNQQIFPSSIQHFLLQTGEANFRSATLISLIFATLLPFLVSFYAYNKHYRGLSVYMLLILYWILLINSLQHIAGSLILHAYSPGVITALLFNLPVSGLILYNSAWLFGTKRKIHLILLPLSIIFLLLTLSFIWVSALLIQSHIIYHTA